MGLYLDDARKLQWRRRLRGKLRAYGQARYKSSQLHVSFDSAQDRPVPARYEAHSSVSSVSHLSLDPCLIRADHGMPPIDENAFSFAVSRASLLIRRGRCRHHMGFTAPKKSS
jgi:hypothetical protein